jgi:hypothetical protein
MEDATDYIAVAHCNRAIGYIWAELVDKGDLPPDFLAPQLLELWEDALKRTLDISEASPVRLNYELVRSLLNAI